MAEYNWTHTLKTATGREVFVCTPDWYGYWSRLDGSEGGGLWFERVDDKLHLIDCDGGMSLPVDIVTCLREAGFVVSEDFE